MWYLDNRKSNSPVHLGSIHRLLYHQGYSESRTIHSSAEQRDSWGDLWQQRYVVVSCTAQHRFQRLIGCQNDITMMRRKLSIILRILFLGDAIPSQSQPLPTYVFDFISFVNEFG